MEDKDLYDDDQAILFIRNYLPQEMKEKFSDDDLVYVIDLIYDFYESKGFLDGDDDEEVSFDVDELTEYVHKASVKDHIQQFTLDEIDFIVQGELTYGDHIDRIIDGEGEDGL
jgi:hypothetical protein